MNHVTEEDDRYKGRGRPINSKSKKNKKGGIKLAILHLLQEEPMHGYQIMKELEKKSNGLYNPSAGTIYPALQELLEKGLIDIELKKEKKVYLINENGQNFISEFFLDENINFWSEWRKRLKWKQSKDAALLREAIEKWDEELHKAKKQLIRDPKSSSELISILSNARSQVSQWRKEKEESK